MSDYDDMEEEPLEVEEEEEEMEIEFDYGQSEAVIKQTYLQQIVSTYNAFLYQHPATLLPGGRIQLNIPASFLPLAQQFAYGYNCSPTLINFDIEIGDPYWTSKPLYYSIAHPVLGNKYIGKKLVQQVIYDFFTPNYQPKQSYKSATSLLSAAGIADPDKLDIMKKEGYDEARSESALIVCYNDLDAARAFLRTGEPPKSETKLIIEFHDCPLLYLVLEMCDAIIDISDHCCLCRKELLSAGVKPSVCDNPLCAFGFTELGIGTSLISEIKRDPAAADLLISCFGAATLGNFLSPTPNNLEETPTLKAEWRKIVAGFPSVAEMACCESDEKLSNRIGAGSMDLLRWIILSNKAQLLSLPDDLRLPDVPATAQFLTMISNEERERRFKELKARFGACFLWHGSSGDRWHSIIRSNVKNATGTAMQANGAAHGPGIYMARNLSTSSGYSRSVENPYTASRLGKQLQVVAMCEVAMVPELKDHGWAHTLTKEDACVVRFMFVSANFDWDIIKKPPRVPTLSDVLEYQAKHAK